MELWFEPYLDIFDQACCAVCHLFGCLDKVPLGHRVTRLAGSHLTGVTQYAGVFGNDCGSS